MHGVDRCFMQVSPPKTSVRPVALYLAALHPLSHSGGSSLSWHEGLRALCGDLGASSISGALGFGAGHTESKGAPSPWGKERVESDHLGTSSQVYLPLSSQAFPQSL